MNNKCSQSRRLLDITNDDDDDVIGEELFWPSQVKFTPEWNYSTINQPELIDCQGIIRRQQLAA